jgi:S-adenosylmethionine synthetase
MSVLRVFTSESVCAGHPDKVCDQVSDAILDAILDQDPLGRVAVETVVGKEFIAILGEVTTEAKVDYEKVVRTQIKRLGYTLPALKFTDQSPLTMHMHQQSPEIAAGVKKKGAGDQGMMFGYACRETPHLMPLPIAIAHALTARVDEMRETKKLPYLRPDGKSQVTVEYENNVPKRVSCVVLAVPHSEDVSLEQVKHDIYTHVVQPVLEDFGFAYQESELIINGTGVWHMSGPASDAGLTGRKIIVDTYGGYARVGGGAFSGKDPSKVDRSGAYAARFIAKNVVAAGLAERAEVSLAYYIGAKQPVMKEVETFGTAAAADTVIRDFVNKILDCSVEGILEGLQLRRPGYLKTAAYGHFGRPGFTWEEVKPA